MSYDEAHPFFELHRDLPREGPGEAADVIWAAQVADLAPNAQMADVGCGPGGDIGSLLEMAPQGHVTALDKTAHFVDAARQSWGADDRVTVLRADMAQIMNAYDMIWCAGAVYFLGVTQALRKWRKAVNPGGVIAFSQVCWYTDAPSDEARQFWEAGYPEMTDEAGVLAQIDAAGYEVLGTKRLSDAAWEAYFEPIDARVAVLSDTADDALRVVLDEAAEEAAIWRAHRDEFGYLLCVVRPA